MTFWPGPVGRVRLAGEDDLERALGVPQHPGQPVDVGEQQPGTLVGREPASEADRQDRRVERRIELGEHRRRLAVAGELAAQPALREVRELALLPQVRVPQVARRDALEALPEAALLRWTRRGRRGRHRRSARAGPRSAAPIQVGPWTPLVMPRIRWSTTPVQVPLAVSAWSWLTALAPLVRRSEKAVMSNCERSPSVPTPELAGPCRSARRRRRAAGRRPVARGRPRSARSPRRPACGS